MTQTYFDYDLHKAMQPRWGEKLDALVFHLLIKPLLGWWDCAGGRCSAGEEAGALGIAAMSLVTLPEDGLEVAAAKGLELAGDAMRQARQIEDLISSANRAINETGLSRAAQKLSSHSQRLEGTFPKPIGGVAERNAQAEQVLRGILQSRDAVRTPLSRGGFDVRLPSGQGARFDGDASFVTFLDPKR
jgi:hypothetical protein